jgi:hypothetical protein
MLHPTGVSSDLGNKEIDEHTGTSSTRASDDALCRLELGPTDRPLIRSTRVSPDVPLKVVSATFH